MDMTALNEKLKLQIQNFTSESSRKQNKQFYEASENYNVLISSIYAHTISRSLAAPFLRIKSIQQAAFESLPNKPKQLRVNEAFKRELKRYSR